MRKLIKKLIPKFGIQFYRKIKRKYLKFGPMNKVIFEFNKRGVKLRNLCALEVYGALGDRHTIDYAKKVKSLDVWENDSNCYSALRKNLPSAIIKITDSYNEIKRTKRKYDLVVIDNPLVTHSRHCEHFDLFPDIFRILNNEVILIINFSAVLLDDAKKDCPSILDDLQIEKRKEFYNTDDPFNISFDRIVNTYQSLFNNNGFNVDWFFKQTRTPYISYIVFKLSKVQ
jgi:hypothetical protein